MSTPLIRCTRCNRRLRNSMEGWNVDMKAGRIAAVLCPDCQTLEENTEAEINEATTDYRAARDAFGRLILSGRPKGADK